MPKWNSPWGWLWNAGPPNIHDATIDQEGKWPYAMVNFRSYRARQQAPDVAPPGWMSAAGSYSQIGNIMPVSVAFVTQSSLPAQLNLPNIGPVDESAQRAAALQAALAASLSGQQNAPR
jgi:hypothetical protein